MRLRHDSWRLNNPIKFDVINQLKCEVGHDSWRLNNRSKFDVITYVKCEVR